MKFKDRGLLKEGYHADLVIFDKDKILDLATFQDPHKYPQGIDYVIVNGNVVISKGEHTGKLPGKILRKND
jgi:N-acyl-D-amino-acid deacylase